MGLITEETFRTSVPTEQVAIESNQKTSVLFGVRRRMIESLANFFGRQSAIICRGRNATFPHNPRMCLPLASVVAADEQVV